MKKLLFTLTVVSFISICAFAEDNKTKWDLFSINMKHALKNVNPGVRLGALKMIIRHNEKLTDSEHFINVSREFNESKDLKIRKAALIALYKLDHDAAIEFFRQQKNLEENEAIRKKMNHIVSAYQKNIAQADLVIDNCFQVCSCCNFVNITF